MGQPALAVAPRPGPALLVAATRRPEAQRRFMTAAALLYVHLWVLEGALRKWVPPLEGPMYIARDALLMLALVAGALLLGRSAQRPAAAAVFWTCAFALTAFVLVQTIVLPIAPAVAAIGLRNYIAPFLLLYVAARSLGPEFYPRAARALLVWAPLQLALAVVQVLSPTTAVINQEVGGEEALLTTSEGIVRASGTFAAPNGLIGYQTLVIAVALAAVFSGVQRDRVLTWVALLCTFVGIAIGGSRAAVFAVLLVVVAIAVQALLSLRARPTLLIVLVAALLGATALAAQALLPQVVDAFLTRFTVASRQEDLLARILDGLGGFVGATAGPLGDGAGTHSPPGIALGSGYQWIEADNLRWAVELGLLGTVLAGARVLIFAIGGVALLANLRRLSPQVVALAALVLPIGLAGTIAGSAPSDQGLFSLVCALLLLAPRWATADDAGTRPR